MKNYNELIIFWGHSKTFVLRNWYKWKYFNEIEDLIKDLSYLRIISKDLLCTWNFTRKEKCKDLLSCSKHVPHRLSFQQEITFVLKKPQQTTTQTLNLLLCIRIFPIKNFITITCSGWMYHELIYFPEMVNKIWHSVTSWKIVRVSSVE